jgi:cell division protein FtsQ
LVKRQDAPVRRKSRPLAEGFWDRPPLLNLLADVLFLGSIIVFVYASVITVVRLPLFPLKQVLVSVPLKQVTLAQIEYAAQSSLTGNFFTVNLDGVRSAFEKLPWVRKTSVRRRWPDGIELTIEEHVAAARWHNSDDEVRLVNDQGEVFAASLPADQSPLPLFGGPEGSSALMLARYREFTELLAPLGRVTRGVMLSARQAWQLRLDDGLLLELGRDQAKHPLHERLQRFTGIYREVQKRTRTSIAAIDMRYPNGFALRLGRGETGLNPNHPSSLGKGNT